LTSLVFPSVRVAKDTGLRNLPLRDLDQNRLWCALVPLACEVTAWAQLRSPHGHQARRWEPKRLRLGLLSIPGRLAVSGRRTILHLPSPAPWARLLEAVDRLRLAHARAPG
jgi:Transposase DDE domain group 1